MDEESEANTQHCCDCLLFGQRPGMALPNDATEHSMVMFAAVAAGCKAITL